MVYIIYYEIWSLFQKKSKQWRRGGGGVRIWNFRWLIKNEVEFPRVKQKNGKFQW